MGDEELRNACKKIPFFFEGGQRGILQTPGYNVHHTKPIRSELFGGA